MISYRIGNLFDTLVSRHKQMFRTFQPDLLDISGDFTAKVVDECPELWFAARERGFSVGTAERVGIGFASPEDQARPWRFVAK